MKLFILFMIMIASIAHINAQSNKGILRGSIQNARQEMLPGISIQLEGTSQGSVTNEDGFYEIRNIAPGNYKIIVSGIGYKISKENVVIKLDAITALYLQLNESTKELEEVTIKATPGKKYLNSIANSGTRLSLPLLETPQSIQVIPQQIIHDQQAQNLNDVVKNMTGVISNNMYTSYTMRGFLNSYYNQFITFDGYIGNMYWWNQMVQLYNIDRVEEIAGPASALYSTGSPGGVINMVTKKPLENSASSFNLVAGSWGLIDASADFGGPVSKNRKLLYRLNIGFNNQNSFRDRIFNTNYVAAPSFLYKISDKTSLSADFVFTCTQQKDGEDHGGYVLMKPDSTYDWKNINIKFNFGSPADYSRINNNAITLKFSHKFSDNVQLTYMSRFIYQHLSSGEIYGYYWGDNYFTALPDSMTRGYNTWDYKDFNFQNSIFSTISIGKKALRQTLVIGADYQRYGDIHNRYISDAAPSISFMNPDYSHDKFDFTINSNTNVWDVISSTRQFGAYIQDLINVNEKLKILLSGRFDNYNYKIRPHSPDASSYITNDTSVANVFLPRFGVVYSFDKRNSVYASYCQSFQPQYSNLRPSGGPFPPQKGKQYEIGYKGLFFDGKLLSALALYSIKFVNILQTDPSDPSGIRQIVIPGLTSDGIELTLQGNINTQWNIIAGYAYNHVVFADNSPLGPKGGRYDNAPSHVANFWVKYSLPETTLLKGLSIAAGGKYVGDRVGSSYNQHFTMPAYFVADAAVNYNFNRFNIGLNAYNLFDKHYAVGYYSSDLMVQVGAPFNWKLSVRYSIK
ncbi:MAG: TonB-dependent receptor [Bacteroidetes bacterium]|nr:TonB-dependent receptor [Bacteroidota bacterium]